MKYIENDNNQNIISSSPFYVFQINSPPLPFSLVLSNHIYFPRYCVIHEL